MLFFFFFQAEDGIRDYKVTGVQTCALPISNGLIGTHLVPACMDHGIPEVQAASLLAGMGGFDLIRTPGSRRLSHPFHKPPLPLRYYRPPGPSPPLPPHRLPSPRHRPSLFAR